MLSGSEGFTLETDQDEVRKIERQLKNRFPIGSHVSEQRIVQDFLKQVSFVKCYICGLVPNFNFLNPNFNFQFSEPWDSVQWGGGGGGKKNKQQKPLCAYYAVYLT